MTAAHVVKDNIWSTFHNFLNENKYKECYVDFNYNGKKSKDTDSKYVFDIEKTVYFDPDTLDVAVLKLKRETHKEFPPPLESFKILDPEKNDDQHIYLIGHDKGDKLHINYGIGLWNPTEKRLKDLEKFCQEYGKENGYKELDRKDRLVIQCKFVSGASGCPGVIIHEDKATVVLIYTRGFPDFYFSKNFPEKKRREFPNERLLQQGVNIGPVFKSMTRNKMYLDLRNEIFPHQASEEQQQLNGQHQYAIDGAKKSINTYNPESSFENVKNLEDHITVRQETENNMAKVTTCTEGHSETAIQHASKYDRQESYALATGKRENIAYPHMKPPADDTDKTLQQETNLDVNAASEILDTVQEDKSVPNTNPGKIQQVTDITIEEWIGHDIQAYQGNQLKDLDLSILSKAINISKANSVALQLGLSQSDFEIIRYQTQADLCYLILYKWRNKTGNAATLEKLIGNLFRAWESDNGSVFTEQLKSAILKVMK
ncbi:unnamed protein product [Mytilus coruscus]|uniref:Death domain-containing protein n=1 Tax=Mytilus coruscus TaxID=42192 RepID=A0A6J8EZ92_MYTCO|nr:unnamed protein product [Mytilus coruscus]